jgi:hypothetical protein
MAGGEGGHWPLCAVCSERCQEPTVVEEYGIPADGVIRKKGRIVRFTVVASCSHGRGFRPGTVRTQRARIEVPEWWGIAHQDDAIRSLIFFVPGHGNPEHTLVTHIGNG